MTDMEGIGQALRAGASVSQVAADFAVDEALVQQAADLMSQPTNPDLPDADWEATRGDIQPDAVHLHLRVGRDGAS